MDLIPKVASWQGKKCISRKARMKCEETAGTANLLVSSSGLFEQSEDTTEQIPKTARFFFL